MTARTDKAVTTACAIAAWHGILATPSRDDRGRPTIILARGAWTREIRPEQLPEALAEFRQLRAEVAAA